MERRCSPHGTGVHASQTASGALSPRDRYHKHMQGSFPLCCGDYNNGSPQKGAPRNGALTPRTGAVSPRQRYNHHMQGSMVWPSSSDSTHRPMTPNRSAPGLSGLGSRTDERLGLSGLGPRTDARSPGRAVPHGREAAGQLSPGKRCENPDRSRYIHDIFQSHIPIQDGARAETSRDKMPVCGNMTNPIAFRDRDLSPDRLRFVRDMYHSPFAEERQAPSAVARQPGRARVETACRQDLADGPLSPRPSAMGDVDDTCQLLQAAERRLEEWMSFGGDRQSGNDLVHALAKKGGASRETSPKKRFIHQDWAANVMPRNRRDFDCPIRAADNTDLGRRKQQVESRSTHHICEEGVQPVRALSAGRPGTKSGDSRLFRMHTASTSAKFVPHADRIAR